MRTLVLIASVLALAGPGATVFAIAGPAVTMEEADSRVLEPTAEPPEQYVLIGMPTQDEHGEPLDPRHITSCDVQIAAEYPQVASDQRWCEWPSAACRIEYDRWRHMETVETHVESYGPARLLLIDLTGLGGSVMVEVVCRTAQAVGLRLTEVGHYPVPPRPGVPRFLRWGGGVE